MQLTQATREQLVSSYLSGKTQACVAEEFGVSQWSVWRSLRLAGVGVNKSESCRKYTIDHTAFNTATEESEYFSGLLATDGCLSDDSRGHRSTRVVLKLHVDDIDLVEKFASFVKTDTPVRIVSNKQYDGGRYASLEFPSNGIAQALSSVGITPQKSKTLFITSEYLVGSNHFWRGCIDGDGSIYLDHPRGKDNQDTRPKVVLGSASRDFLSQYCTYLSTLFGGWSPKVGKYTTSNGGTFYRVSVSGSRAVDLLTALYKGATVYLNRKYQVAKGILGGI